MGLTRNCRFRPMEPSPSNCTYCYSLECSIRIESLSSSHKKGALTAKQAIVTVGRNANRSILLQVELVSARTGGNPAVASYPLADCVVHQQGITQGRGSIEIPSRKMAIQMNNCAPRKLNVFMKSLQAKLDIMKGDNAPGVLRTPVNVARTMLMQGLPNVFNVLSPLSIGEIRKVRRMRGVATGDSPLAKGCRSPVTPRTSSTLTANTGADTAAPTSRVPLSATTPKAPQKRLSSGNLRSAQEKSSRVQLSDEQRAVVRAVVQGGQNVFFTGSAGTGKSLVLRRIIEMLPAASTYVTAATGVAACQLGGVTLHSFAGIGLGNGTPEQSLRIAESKKAAIKQWKLCTHLIIDEISMVDSTYFTNIEFVARSIRGDDRPFGGIQLIITGDFLQLPPVTKNNDPSFCFESAAWSRSIQKTILLQQVRRQDDQRFVEILQQIRVGRCDASAAATLDATRRNDFSSRGIVPTRLCTHTADADAVNRHSLEAIDGVAKTYPAEDGQFIPDTVQSMIPKTLVLKETAQVMLTKNLDLSRGLSNGSRGVVTRFAKSGFPMVKFLATEEEIEILPVRFPIRVPGLEEAVCRRQLPLQLAWAISVHKSQGLTLDAVEMSLARVFAEGQSYVALSRARSLDSIRVLGFDPTVIRASQKVVRYYESIKENCSEEDDGLDGFVIRKRSRVF